MTDAEKSHQTLQKHSEGEIPSSMNKQDSKKVGHQAKKEFWIFMANRLVYAVPLGMNLQIIERCRTPQVILNGMRKEAMVIKMTMEEANLMSNEQIVAMNAWVRSYYGWKSEGINHYTLYTYHF
jgi:hypothetical protein